MIALVWKTSEPEIWFRGFKSPSLRNILIYLFVDMNIFGKILNFICPGIVDRINQQIRVVKKIKRLKRINVLRGNRPGKSMRDVHLERYKKFYNRIKFSWDPCAEEL